MTTVRKIKQKVTKSHKMDWFKIRALLMLERKFRIILDYNPQSKVNSPQCSFSITSQTVVLIKVCLVRVLLV
jgi:hypothetical protein